MRVFTVFSLMALDTLQGNVCDAVKDHFVIKVHGGNTRKD